MGQAGNTDDDVRSERGHLVHVWRPAQHLEQ